MNKIELNVENIKCHGCANTIKHGLLKLDGISDVIVDVPGSKIEVEFDESMVILENIKNKLSFLGYPEKGKNNTILKAKSYVSCAIGRVKN